MAENTENLVLRTVYLAADVDRHLKRLAFSRSITKNELIRTILRDGLAAYDGETIGERLEVAAAPVAAAKPNKRPKTQTTDRAPARARALEPAE